MGVGVEVVAPEGWPEADEPIASFARCPGNILMACEDVGFPRLDKCEQPEQASEAMRALIVALDEGDEGIFDFDYWEACDERWSKGREIRKALAKWREVSEHLREHGYTPEQMVAAGRREKARTAAWRFLSYFEMGYVVEWDY